MPHFKLSQTLNQQCDCVTLDQHQLMQALDAQVGAPGFAERLQQSHPHLFSASATFIPESHLRSMQALVAATRRLARRPAYQTRALANADIIARKQPLHDSVFFGYDFHVDAEGPHLIEINTNAGGGLLNAFMAEAQRICCDDVSKAFEAAETQRLPARLFGMFRQEWQLARGDRPLRSIAIVDDAPQQQGLYPEFLLFQSLFAGFGVEAHIFAPDELSLDNGVLVGEHNGQHMVVDLVYSRLTDFYFAEESHRVLREAWLSDAAVITPTPHAYALYADKRNMIVMSDEASLRAMNVLEEDIALFLRCVPLTRSVKDFSPETLWTDRKRYFFKPAQGFGSKAVWRGDKLTRRNFDELYARGDYLVQAFHPPGQRRVMVQGADSELKFDVRAYVYQGEIQLLAARLYQGQTTNLRTAGGGFSGILLVKDAPCS